MISRPQLESLKQLSPWSDITETGYSYAALKDAEPLHIYEKNLKHAADAYADPKDSKHPYVFSVYDDFARRFPPTLIRGGAKEIFAGGWAGIYCVRVDFHDNWKRTV